MLFAFARPRGDTRRRLVIVGDRFFGHWNEEVERRHDGLQIRDYRAAHHVLRSCNCLVGSTLEEAMLTVNLDAVEPPRGQAGDTAARPAVRRRELCYSPRRGLLLFFLDNKADLSIDAVHRDLVVLDDAFGILDPERFDAAHRAALRLGVKNRFERALFERVTGGIRGVAAGAASGRPATCRTRSILPIGTI
jgi:hypothetical protein